MPSTGFEPTFSAGERPQTYALYFAATGTGIWYLSYYIFYIYYIYFVYILYIFCIYIIYINIYYILYILYIYYIYLYIFYIYILYIFILYILCILYLRLSSSGIWRCVCLLDKWRRFGGRVFYIVQLHLKKETNFFPKYWYLFIKLFCHPP